MSFVRAGREVETVDVFPKSIKDQANGPGTWPLLQSYAYRLGVEVRFDSDLDELFGITNDNPAPAAQRSPGPARAMRSSVGPTSCVATRPSDPLVALAALAAETLLAGPRGVRSPPFTPAKMLA